MAAAVLAHRQRFVIPGGPCGPELVSREVRRIGAVGAGYTVVVLGAGLESRDLDVIVPGARSLVRARVVARDVQVEFAGVETVCERRESEHNAPRIETKGQSGLNSHQTVGWSMWLNVFQETVMPVGPA